MKSTAIPLILLAAVACSRADEATTHHIAVVEPGHFHAALVAKSPLPGVDDTIRVYTSGDNAQGIAQFSSFIDTYNNAAEKPTHWQLDIIDGADYMSRMAADNVSDIVVLAGDNKDKTHYIIEAVRSGKNVLADKPMAINSDNFDLLVEAYSKAGENGAVIYELMTERYDTLNILTRQLLQGRTLQGSPEQPAVTMKSTHHFYKEVSGKPLTRPAWYYDTAHQGEGIADVTTHLLDLIMWQCFPGEAIDYRNDVEVLDAGHWATVITPGQYVMSTGDTVTVIPDDGLEVYSNGYILASIKGVPVRLEVQWNFRAPEGGGDTFEAVYHTEDGDIVLRQDATTAYAKELYTVDPAGTETHHPVTDRLGHEEHFNKVTEAFMKYIDGENLPDWEIPNSLAKYYITTQALNKAQEKQ